MFCWFERKCGKVSEICKNGEDCLSCVRYVQMHLQTVEANIPGLLPLNHQLEKPKSPESPDWRVYMNLHSIDLDKFVESGRSMVIESDNYGNGKTTWAQRLLLKYLASKIGKSNSGYFISLPEALFNIKNSIRTGESVPYEEIFKTKKLLVLDDVSSKKLTEYEESWLFRCISIRALAGLSTIYTLNTSRNLEELIGGNLYSRIYNGSEHYRLEERDKRGWDKVEW